MQSLTICTCVTQYCRGLLGMIAHIFPKVATTILLFVLNKFNYLVDVRMHDPLLLIVLKELHDQVDTCFDGRFFEKGSM